MELFERFRLLYRLTSLTGRRQRLERGEADDSIRRTEVSISACRRSCRERGRFVVGVPRDDREIESGFGSTEGGVQEAGGDHILHTSIFASAYSQERH